MLFSERQQFGVVTVQLDFGRNPAVIRLELKSGRMTVEFRPDGNLIAGASDAAADASDAAAGASDTAFGAHKTMGL